ncbi:MULTISPECIES: acyltransferase family protein [Streptococcus]|uniref:Fucose 4-O-acetylase n=1 Tax=Streptococcus equinus TaxID=1335 RepID=A0AAE8HJF5_STREI|nr:MULTISPECIES: acyltransferase family protein [Streptococcus]WFM81041.1 acyltransferase family protein [Streptococcus ruminicola]SDW25955.1 Fucose 4-O-acetylase [Streptococcus equinus]
MKKRLKYIDIARGIAIILVVMGHCDNFEQWSIERFAALFFMQLFIFISGYFYKANLNSVKDLLLLIKKKCLPIYLYYLKFELLFFALTNFFLKIGFYNPSTQYGSKTLSYVTSFKDVVTNIIRIILLAGREPFCGAFWFLVTLIFVVIEYSVIIYVSNIVFNDSKKRNRFINISVIFFFIVGCIMRYTVSIPRISPAVTMLLFYHIGGACRRKEIKFNSLLLFLTSIVGLNILYFLGTISINSNYFKDPFFLLICSFFGIYMVMYTSKYIENHMRHLSLILSYIGKNTLPIVALHFVTFKIVMLIQYYFGSISFSELGNLKGANNSNFLYILYVVTGIFAPLYINFIFEYISKKVSNILIQVKK